MEIAGSTKQTLTRAMEQWSNGTKGARVEQGSNHPPYPSLKYKIMTSAKEKDTTKETCVVAGWERGHCR